MGNEKILLPGGRIFFNRFSGDILFLSLLSFAFSYSCFCFLLVCSLKSKIYMLLQIRLCGQVIDKKFFIRPISGNKTTFFWPKVKFIIRLFLI